MFSRSSIATTAVIAGLGGLATAALTTHPDGATTAASAPAIVRTQTELHTITRARRDLPPVRPRPAAAVAPPPAAAASAAATPVAPAAQETPAAQPLRTRASGALSGGEHKDDFAEHEGDERDD